MKRRKGRLKGRLAASVIPIMVLALLAPRLAADESRGAQVVVTRNDGILVRGELLAVKGTDLLIMEGSARGGVSVSLAEVKLVTVVKRGKAGLILGGVLLGGAAGGGLGAAVESGQHGFMSGVGKEARTRAGAVLGVLVGGLLGVAMCSNKEFPVDGASPDSVNVVASKLRPLARDRG